MNAMDLSRVNVSAHLPSLSRLSGNDPIPPDIVGGTIIAIGAPSEHCDLEGGGLVVDFVPRGESSVRRLVLGLNELGMWVEYDGYRGA
jgi:hypothetical protein